MHESPDKPEAEAAAERVEVGGAGIDAEELRFTFQRSGGPGGQNVNKVNTRVTLLFDLLASPSLTAEQKELIGRRLATRISRDGVLRVVSSRHRTQSANRRAALARFVELLTAALHVEKPRKPTRIPPAARRRRREEKASRARVKDLRRPPRSGEE